MADFINRGKLADVFVTKVCSSCNVCSNRTCKPSFCMALFGSDRDRFFKFLEYFGCLQLVSKDRFTREVIATLRRFSGFCGLFCNSYIKCPLRSAECNEVAKPMGCYRQFLTQDGLSLDGQTAIAIYGSFSGVEMNTVGSKYALPVSKIFKSLFSKKDRKIVKKSLRKVKEALRNSATQYPYLATRTNNTNYKYTKQGRKKKAKCYTKKPKPVTTMFCNDDEEWKKKIDFYLEKKPVDETHNRQSTDTTQHT